MVWRVCHLLSYWIAWRNNVLRNLEAKKVKLVSIIIFMVQPHHLRHEPIFPPYGLTVPAVFGI